jgi:rod shape-determining protein MreB and related proteins
MRFDFFTSNIAIDLGTANTLVYAPGRGIVLNEPSVIALVDYKGGLVPYAFGHEAKMMLGRTPEGIRAIRPLKDGVIADFRAAEEMIKHFIKKAQTNKSFFARPTIIVCVPYGSTPVERRAIQESVEGAGAKNVYLIEEPMAAAIGAGLPVTEPSGSMVVDIGGGTTEVGMISLGGIVCAQSIRVGGDTMDDALISYVKRTYNLLIGEQTAEKIKREIGTASIISQTSSTSSVIRGRDLATGVPKEIIVSADKIAESLLEPVQHIINAIKFVLEASPPELSGDIVERGLILTGGGALLGGLSEIIQKHTGLNVQIADEPLHCVAFGTGKTLDNFRELRHVLFKQY